MDIISIAAARHHTYQLFSRFFLNGVTTDLLPYIEQIPELSAISPEPFDPQEAAAIHYQVFSLDIFPFESIFRDPSGLLGGVYSSQVQERYQQAGFQQTTDCDHIGYELAFLATLCGSEGAALEREEIAKAVRSQELQKAFFQDHLVCWLPAFVNALAFCGQAFYAAVGQLTLDLVYDHFLQLGQGYLEGFETPISSEKHELLDSCTLPDMPDILQDEGTDLKQISRFLVTPPFCGLYLGRTSITTMARDRQLPRGFGDRRQMLSNLLRAAGQYDAISDLLQDLAAKANSWSEGYQEQLVNYPEIGDRIRPWQQRVNNTSHSLVQMANLATTKA